MNVDSGYSHKRATSYSIADLAAAGNSFEWFERMASPTRALYLLMVFRPAVKGEKCGDGGLATGSKDAARRHMVQVWRGYTQPFLLGCSRTRSLSNPTRPLSVVTMFLQLHADV